MPFSTKLRMRAMVHGHFWFHTWSIADIAWQVKNAEWQTLYVFANERKPVLCIRAASKRSFMFLFSSGFYCRSFPTKRSNYIQRLFIFWRFHNLELGTWNVIPFDCSFLSRNLVNGSKEISVNRERFLRSTSMCIARNTYLWFVRNLK